MEMMKKRERKGGAEKEQCRQRDQIKDTREEEKQGRMNEEEEEEERKIDRNGPMRLEQQKRILKQSETRTGAGAEAHLASGSGTVTLLAVSLAACPLLPVWQSLLSLSGILVECQFIVKWWSMSDA